MTKFWKLCDESIYSHFQQVNIHLSVCFQPKGNVLEVIIPQCPVKHLQIHLCTQFSYLWGRVLFSYSDASHVFNRVLDEKCFVNLLFSCK